MPRSAASRGIISTTAPWSSHSNSHPATYISYADEKDISNPNQTWLRSDVPGHQNDRLWGTYFEKEAVGAATVLLSKSAFDPCPAGYRIPLIAPLKFTGNDVESYTTEGVWLYVDSQRSVKAWYPYAGSRFSKMDEASMVSAGDENNGNTVRKV